MQANTVAIPTCSRGVCPVPSSDYASDQRQTRSNWINRGRMPLPSPPDPRPSSLNPPPVEPSRTQSNQKCGLTAQPRVASKRSEAGSTIYSFSPFQPIPSYSRGGYHPPSKPPVSSTMDCGLWTVDSGLRTLDCGSLATQTNRMPQKANPFLRPGRLAPRYSWSLEFGTLPPVEAVEVNRTQSPLKNFFCSLKPPPAALLFRRAGIIVRRPENVAAVDKVFRVIHERFL